MSWNIKVAEQKLFIQGLKQVRNIVYAALVIKHATTQNHPKPPTASQNHPKQAKTRRSHPKLITNTQSHSKPSNTEHYCQNNPQPPTTT